MLDSIHPEQRWLHSCVLLLKVVSVAFLLASALYLIFGGINYAVVDAIFVDAQRRGTMVLVACLVWLFVMYFALGLLGLNVTYHRERIRWYLGAAVVVAIATIVCVSTAYFGVRDSAFGKGVIDGLSLVSCALAIVSLFPAIQIELDNRRYVASREDDGDELDVVDAFGVNDADGAFASAPIDDDPAGSDDAPVDGEAELGSEAEAVEGDDDTEDVEAAGGGAGGASGVEADAEADAVDAGADADEVGDAEAELELEPENDAVPNSSSELDDSPRGRKRVAVDVVFDDEKTQGDEADDSDAEDFGGVADGFDASGEDGADAFPVVEDGAGPFEADEAGDADSDDAAADEPRRAGSHWR